MKNVAILGATSHIAKGMIEKFFIHDGYECDFFVRNEARLRTFLKDIGKEDYPGVFLYDEFGTKKYDVVINCVGFGKPADVSTLKYSIFSVIEHYDNLCIEYIKNNPESIYIHFSSGAVYGKALDKPQGADTVSTYMPNHIQSNDYYRIAKLYAESKHRSLEDLKIWDIRVFNYLSRFIDLESGLLITSIINAIVNKEVFLTNSLDIVRDFIHPDDLFKMITLIIEKNSGNNCVDTYSLAPIKKFDLLKVLKDTYGLDYSISRGDVGINATGSKNIYCSNNYSAEKLLGFKPLYTSEAGILDELGKILK